MRKQLLTLSVIVLSAITASASDYQCELDESVRDVEYSSTYTVPLSSASEGGVLIPRTPGGMTSGGITLKNDNGIFALVDPSTKKEALIQVGTGEGSFTRIHFITDVESNDFLYMSCQRGELIETKERPLGFTCTMTETSGSTREETVFDVPVAQSGHDFTEIPTATLTPVYGWVMGYSGNFIAYLQNKETFAGITVVGSWDKPVSLSWHPSLADIQVKLTCSQRL